MRWFRERARQAKDDAPTDRESSSSLFLRHAAGDADALQILLARHHENLMYSARFYMKRLRVFDPAYTPDDAVQDAMLKYAQAAMAGRLGSLKTSVEHWKLIFRILKNEILTALGRSQALKRRGLEERSLSEIADDRDGAPSGSNHGRRGDPRERSQTPSQPPDDLFFLHEEVLLILEALDGAGFRAILEMKIQGYTNDEIAAKLDVSVRTIYRRINELRQAYDKRALP